ncbi:MAG: NAD(P)-dependent alcohol dehydrogenase [Coriobacteriales bacterium]|jgi:aryl-alcohol dehydrogenase
MRIKAAVTYEKGKFQFDEIELDEPKSDEVLVKMVASGCCHTDLGGRDQMAPWPIPGVLGHEGAGIVEKVGDMVYGIKPGDHVVLSYQSCGHCDNCLEGHPAKCDSWYPLNFLGRLADGTTRLHTTDGKDLSVFFGQSSFAEYSVVNQRQVAVVDPEVDLTYLGPLGCGFLTGFGSIVNVLKVGFGDTVAVFGVGGVGLAAIMAARIAGAQRIIAVGRRQPKLDLALEMGATDVVNSKEVDPVEAIRNITGGKGVKYAFDTSGVATVIKQAVDASSAYGTICTVAMSPDNLTLGIEQDLMGPGRTVKGSTEGDAVCKTFIPKMVDYYKQGRFPFDKLCKVYDFENIEQAFQDSIDGKVIKPIVKIS